MTTIIEAAVDRPTYLISIGGVLASRSPVLMRTTLGSCIAVCLFDPSTGIGGMNHFMLPGVDRCFTHDDDGDHVPMSTRYGVHAMELLINECMKAGAHRHSFTAKVFGGGHVLSSEEGDDSIPMQNIRFVEDFLGAERIRVAASDVGGRDVRTLYFVSDTGQTFMKRTRIKYASQQVRALRAAEQEYRRRAFVQPDDNVTLF
jgi:chemotaxis receptor (MCP) glutamine deamidase CheD